MPYKDKQAESEHKRVYYQENKPYIRERQKKYYADNRETIREKDNSRKEANKDMWRIDIADQD